MFQTLKKKCWMILIAGAFSLAACANTPNFTCPPLENYEKEVQAQAATEIRDMHAKGIYPVTRRLVVDYRQLRQRLEAVGCSLK